MIERIDGFFGKYRFLSNFHIADVEYEGIIYPTTEAAFQAAKTLDLDDRNMIASLPKPNQARIAGQKVKLRDDWESIKNLVMEQVVLEKFNKHPELKKLLLSTGDAYLREDNSWGDQYWGYSKGFGLNHLGLILMKVRTILNINDVQAYIDAFEKEFNMTTEQLLESLELAGGAETARISEWLFYSRLLAKFKGSLLGF